MLKIFKLKLNKNNLNNQNINNNIDNNISLKKREPNIRNWKNSIYTYNKNTINLIPEASKLAIKLIKSFFYFFNLKLEKKSRLRRKKKYIFNRLSTHKIFLSDGLFKHTNDLVNITIFFYNKQLINFKKKIARRYKKIFIKKRDLLKKKLFLIKKRGLIIFFRYKKIRFYMNKTKIMKNRVFSYKEFYVLCYKRFIKRSFYKFFVYMYLRQVILINEYKFNNYYLQGITNLIKKIYKKNIMFNFINVKYHYFNSDIFTESLLLKIRKNKRKVFSYLKRILLISKIKKLQVNSLVKNTLYFKDLNIKKRLDVTNNLLYDILLQNKSNSIKKIVFDNINYKRVSGIRLKLGGRLSKRNTAARSTTKNKIQGNLITHKYSSLIRGNLKSNLDYTNLNSKVRTGTFGIKGWISGS